MKPPDMLTTNYSKLVECRNVTFALESFHKDLCIYIYTIYISTGSLNVIDPFKTNNLLKLTIKMEWKTNRSNIYQYTQAHT